MDPTATTSEPPAGRISLFARLLRYGLWTSSGLLLVFATACYWGRFDAATVVTLFPPWCWAALGFALAGLGFSCRRPQPSALLALGWIGFLVLFSDSPGSFLRALVPAPDRGTHLRVVSLNCSGFLAAAENIQPLDPDVVLLQEAPRPWELAALVERMYGPGDHMDSSYDPAILTRGTITKVWIPPEYHDNFVHSRVELGSATVNVISLRLNRCPIRLDFWSPDCWRYYAANRASRRAQLVRIARYVGTLPSDEPLVLGGDFNCPPRDAVLKLLEPRLSDAFAVAGRGWGATIIEFRGWPLIRIDQIWTSRQFHTQSAFALPAAPSDHHMTVADFTLAPQKN